jgi:hypothetical protein
MGKMGGPMNLQIDSVMYPGRKERTWAGDTGEVDYLDLHFFEDLHTVQTIDNIYNGGLTLLSLDVKIDVLESRATPVYIKCPQDVFPRGYGKYSQAAGIRTDCITNPNKNH